MNFKANETSTKLRGGYYTPPELVKYLLNWAMEINPQFILEPSCGDGVFINEIEHIKSKHHKIKSISAFEIDDDEATKASTRAKLLKSKTKIHSTDFLAWALGQFNKETYFDTVVGNPPFIRYQYMDENLQEVSNQIFNYFHLPYTKHTNAWVPFVIASIALLRPQGRLAMVVPSEILHVLHANSLRAFLAEQCSKILIIDPEELWFENTLQGAVLILAEKKAHIDTKSHGVSIISTKGDAFLKKSPSKYFSTSKFTNGETLYGKWMKALLTPDELELFNEIIKLQDVKIFKDIADVDVGIVTGANKFFLVPNNVVENYNLHKWAHPMFGRSEHVQGVIYDHANHDYNQEKGLPTNFIWFNGDRFENLHSKAKEYILEGERQELHKRYKCRIREPWYSVPSVYTTTVGMLKRSNHFPRLIHNTTNALTTDTAYRIKPLISERRLVYSFVNSLTALSAELEGRHYGGGVLELVPSEIERLTIPIPSKIGIKLKQLDNYVRNNSPEEILIEQDNNILSAIGLTKSDRLQLFSAWQRLRNRRHRK